MISLKLKNTRERRNEWTWKATVKWEKSSGRGLRRLGLDLLGLWRLGINLLSPWRLGLDCMGLWGLGLDCVGLWRLGLALLGLGRMGLKILGGGNRFEPIEWWEEEDSGDGEESKEENGRGDIGPIEEIVNQPLLLIQCCKQHSAIADAVLDNLIQ